MNSDINHYEWLPMPSGISLSHESFAVDLLKQFDKRRSQLHEGPVTNEEEHIQTNAYSRSLSHHSEGDHSNSHHSDSFQQVTSVSSSHVSTLENEVDIQDPYIEHQEKRRSAGDLIRKSSVYIRSRLIEGPKSSEAPIENTRSLFKSWSLKRKKKNGRSSVENIYRQSNTSLPIASYTLSKVAINTSITIPSNNQLNHYPNTSVQPPVITQYPPKPLKYSPIEPLPDNTGATKKLLHRLSLPLLKLTNNDNINNDINTNNNNKLIIERRRSDSDVRDNNINRQHKTLLENMSKTWSKLLFTCKLRRK